MDIHSKYTKVLIRWMERIVARQPPLILEDGKTTMDFIYVEDVAGFNMLALQSDVTDYEFNGASGFDTSLEQLAHGPLEVMNSDLEPEYGPERKVNAVSRRLANIGKLKQDLGFEAQVDLEGGLQRLVAWWQANRTKAAA